MKTIPESRVGQRRLVGYLELRRGREDALGRGNGRKRPWFFYLSLDWHELSGIFALVANGFP